MALRGLNKAMVRLDGKSRALAICFAAVAGFVDSLGFLTTGGFFVSFMSGNSTRLGIGLAHGHPTVGLAGVLLASFVFGVVIGGLAGRLAGGWRRTAILALVTCLLALAYALHGAGAGLWLAVPLAMAMGAENTIFAEDGDVRVGLTYMTGTLVKMGKRITVALCGGDRWGWVPFFLLWAGLTCGAVLGAFCFERLGIEALLFAIGVMAVFTVVSLTTDLSARRVCR